MILTQECDAMKGPMYQRKPYPETWARMEGKGRVFYTSMGHREDVWTKPEFQALALRDRRCCEAHGPRDGSNAACRLERPLRTHALRWERFAGWRVVQRVAIPL